MNEKISTERKKEKKIRKTQGRVSIRVRLFTSFTLFSLFIITVLWICQILFLDKFYYNTTLDDLRRVSNVLSEQYESEEFSETAQQYAIDGNICIGVYEVTKDKVTSVFSSETSIGCVTHKLTGTQLGLIFNLAAREDGEYYTSSSLKLVYNPRFNTRELRAYLPIEDEGTSFVPTLEDESITADERLLYCRLFAEGENVIMLLLDANLAPVTAVVRTLRLLLFAISLAILFFSLLLAYIISRRLSKPITNMSEKAKNLAVGEYSTDFYDGSYKEVADLGSALNYASERLSSVERMQRELVANISHDLRTPLTMIKGYAEVMRDIEGENTPENTQVIIDETERLAELVNDILVISKHQSGKERLQYVRFDLKSAIEETVSRYRHLKGADGFEFSFEASGEGSVYADRSAILQVVCNLINNAINYAQDKKVEIRCVSNEKTVHVDIIDHGKGIPEDELPLIWERYYKVDKLHSRSRVGSGLGLSIVRNILDLHNARYGVQSTVGVGTRFWFELPLTASLGESEN